MSDKFKVIDHATFERMQQSGSSVAAGAPKIRNSKYKRLSATNNFNLMQFAKSKPQKKDKIRKRVVDKTIEVKKNKGKKRENGVKKPTRLKKSILQYRQKKREQAQLEKQQEQSENETKNLVEDDGIKDKQKLLTSIHSSTFREYCNCYKTSDLKKCCEQLIRELHHFQRRAYAQNEIKARAHKRFVVGFRQVQGYLNTNKIKLVVIATDCERNEGGNVSLDDTIESIKTTCRDKKIPIVFAFRRREMAYFIYKKASISCIGILDYDGARDIFAQVIESLKSAREKYESLLLEK